MCSVGDHKLGEGVSFHVHEGKIICPQHFEEIVLNRCAGCALVAAVLCPCRDCLAESLLLGWCVRSCKQLIRGQYIKISNDFYHAEHWQCA